VHDNHVRLKSPPHMYDPLHLKIEIQELSKDIEILKDGPICKYYKNSILDEDIDWFIDNRFDVYEMNTKDWNRNNFHKRIKRTLKFPEYYGENINAFDDCLGDMKNPRYKGVVLVFRQYDEFIKNSREDAEAILDIVAKESRVWLLEGQKLIALIQSSNPKLELPVLGGISPNWNSAEWLNSERV